MFGVGNTLCYGRRKWLQLSQSCASRAKGKEDFFLLCMTCVACAVTYLIPCLVFYSNEG